MCMIKKVSSAITTRPLSHLIIEAIMDPEVTLSDIMQCVPSTKNLRLEGFEEFATFKQIKCYQIPSVVSEQFLLSFYVLKFPRCHIN